jgi:predicted ATPase/DNA-binding CsgD family transcriptional regulator
MGSGERPRARSPRGKSATGIPAQLTSLIGREQDIVEVATLLALHRLVTITGVGGIGKTRLAFAVGTSVAPDFEDGVWFVDLAPVAEPSQVARAVADSLGIAEQPRRPLAATLASTLRVRNLLLLLDNSEHVVQASAELARVLLAACPDLRILATSREPLGVPGEVTWRAAPLPLPLAEPAQAVDSLQEIASVQLFIERAKAALPSVSLTAADGSAIAEICRQLDGIPLAIELAAARVRVLSVQQIADHLEDRFALLTGGARAGPDRHQTLRAALDWGYELLAEGERRLFDQLSVFAGGWTLEGAEVIGTDPGADPRITFDLQARLVDRSLIVAERRDGGAPIRYRMLETLRQYGLERLAERGETERSRARHAAYYVGLALQAELELRGPRAAAWLDQIALEHDNLRAALTWLIARGDAEGALRLATALRSFWYSRGHFVEGRAWFDRALALPGADGLPASRGKALVGASWLAFALGDASGARTFAHEGLELCRAAGDERGEADAAYVRGAVELTTGSLARARSFGEQALRSSRLARDVGVETSSLALLAMTAATAGDASVAGAWAEEARALLADTVRAPRTRNVAVALLLLGYFYYLRRDHTAARHVAQTSRAIAGELSATGGPTDGATTLLGWLSLEEGDPGAARALFSEVLVGGALQRGERWGTALGLEGLAMLAVEEGQFERALRLAGAAAALRQVIGAPAYPAERVALERWLPAARQALGHAAAEVAERAGHSLAAEEALVEALSEVPPSASKEATSAVLTHREEEVARLIERGLSNREIAGRLIMSERTVHAHVRNILSKLGLASRTQVALWVNEQHTASHQLAAGGPNAVHDATRHGR